MQVSEVLSQAIAQVVFLSSLAERLAHDTGPWTMIAEGGRTQRVAARVSSRDDAVVVTAIFDHPVGSSKVLLVNNGEVAQVLTVDPQAVEVTWELSLGLTMAA